MKSFFKKLLISIAAIFILLIALLATPLGLQLSLEIAKAVLPGKFTYAEASGTLLKKIEIKKLHYASESLDLTVDHLYFRWNPGSLFNKTLNISDLILHTTILKLKKTSEKTSSSFPKLPVFVHLKQARLTHLTVYPSNGIKPLHFSNIVLSGSLQNKRVTLHTTAQLTKPFLATLSFKLEGQPTHYTLAGAVTGSEISWQLEGSGDRNRISLTLHDRRTLEGRLALTGFFQWSPAPRWQLQLQSTHLNLSRLNPDWPHALSLTLNSSGSLSAKQVQALTLDAKLHTPGTEVLVKSIRTRPITLQWQVNATHLQNLYKKFSGQLRTSGTLQIDQTQIKTAGNLHANHLSFLNYQAEQLTVDWQLSNQANQVSQFNLMGSNGGAGAWLFKQFKLKITGRLAQHTLIMEANLHDRLIALHAQGSWNTNLNRWRGTLNKLKLSNTTASIKNTKKSNALTLTEKLFTNTFTTWQLTKPAQLSLSSDQFNLSSLCLRPVTAKMAGNFCLKGSWSRNSDWRFLFSGTQFEPDLIFHALLPKLTLQTKVNLTGSIIGEGTKLKTTKATVQLSPGKINYRTDGLDFSTPLQRGTIVLNYQPEQLEAKTVIIFSKQNRLNAQVRLSKFKLLEGQLKLEFADLSSFQKTFQTIATPSGIIKANIKVSGPLKKPNLEGNVQLINGEAFIPKLGITLKKIGIKIASYSKRQLKFELTAFSENKPINLQALMVETPKKGLTTVIQVRGKDFLLMNTKEYKIYATPILNIILQGLTVYLDGSVTIPEATLKPEVTQQVSWLPSNEIVYTAGEPQFTRSTWQVSANLKIALGKNVRINAAGFNAMITGEATLTGRPQKTTLANGRIEVSQGNYEAYGKSLKIASGSFVQFINSPVNNPLLNLRATTLIKRNASFTQTNLGLNNLIVGVNLKGSFRHPKLTFFSIPATLSQADILSYLVLGYASQNASGKNLGLLLEAANSLGGKGAGVGGAISEIKQSLGLSELGVESENLINAVDLPVGQQTAFVIGKRLTKQLYIRYSLGLGQGPFVPVNLFEARYEFNRHWAIQTDSSTLGNGFDVLYSIETN